VSFDQIMTQWWEFEKKSWDTNVPADPVLGGETLKNELESVSDFEIESCTSDVDFARTLTPLLDDEVEKGYEDLRAFVQDLKKTYTIKIDGLMNSAKKATVPQPAAATPMSSYGARGGHSRVSGNGLGLLIMFIVGLGLGSGLAIFFRESGKKVEEQLKADKDALMQSKREIISEYTALQETYFQLAKGKLMTLPEIDHAMRTIREDAVLKRRQTDIEFSKNRETLLRRVPVGDRLDRALERQETEKKARYREIEKSMNARLDPLLKQKQIHEEIMEQK